MSGSMNRAIILGNVGADPEIRENGGNRMAVFSVATSEGWRDKRTGERREKTEWHRIVVWNEHLANLVESYVRKGTKVLIEGKIRTREWKTESGEKRWSTEITVENFDGSLTMVGGRQTEKEETERRSSNDDEIPF